MKPEGDLNSHLEQQSGCSRGLSQALWQEEADGTWRR